MNKECPNCFKKIDDDKIRCQSCQSAWSEGHASGRQEVRGEIQYFFNKIMLND